MKDGDPRPTREEIITTYQPLIEQQRISPGQAFGLLKAIIDLEGVGEKVALIGVFDDGQEVRDLEIRLEQLRPEEVLVHFESPIREGWRLYQLPGRPTDFSFYGGSTHSAFAGQVSTVNAGSIPAISLNVTSRQWFEVIKPVWNAWFKPLQAPTGR